MEARGNGKTSLKCSEKTMVNQNSMSSKNPSKVEKKDMIQIKKAEIFFNSRTALQKTLKKQGNKQTNTQINKSTGSRE